MAMRTAVGLLLAIAIIGCTEGDQTLPIAFKGYFHLEQVDATNLRLSQDRTFRWQIVGCDFGAIIDGGWTRAGDHLILRSATEEPLTWVDGVSFQVEVDHVELTATDGGGLTAIGRADGGSRLFQQTWAGGGVCAQCGGELGPTGQCGCDDPFTNAIATCQ